MNNLKEKVIKIVKEAGYNMRNINASYVKEKTNSTDLVTDMDIKNQEFLISNLKDLIDNAVFFSEEKENQNLTDEYTWVIDPIDGTSNYAYDYKHSAISVALVYKKETVLACCYNPYLDEMFTAIKGSGSYLNDKKLVVNSNTIDKSLIMVGTSPYDKSDADRNFESLKKLYLKGRDIRRSGSAVLDLCYLACGRVDAFFEYRLSFWDYAAASLIVNEAGGIVNYFGGNYGFQAGIAAGNKNNVDDVLSILND